MKSRKMTLLGHETDVTEVDIVQRTEQFAEYTLEDGSVIRFAAIPTAVLRLDGQFTGDGNPLYVALHGSAVTVLSAPENLRRH